MSIREPVYTPHKLVLKNAMRTEGRHRHRVHFEDRFQDFLWWDVEDEGASWGKVVDCGPCQAWMWVDLEVDLTTALVGGNIRVRKASGEILTIRYPITAIEEVFSLAPVTVSIPSSEGR